MKRYPCPQQDSPSQGLEFCKETAFPPGYSPDRQSLLQHLLRAGADLAFMCENDVLMVNRQANRCGKTQFRSSRGVAKQGGQLLLRGQLAPCFFTCAARPRCLGVTALKTSVLPEFCAFPSSGCGFEWEVAFGEDGFHTDAYVFLDTNQGVRVWFRDEVELFRFNGIENMFCNF